MLQSLPEVRIQRANRGSGLCPLFCCVLLTNGFSHLRSKKGVVKLKNELLLAVTQLAAERNLPDSIVVSAIEAALASAYKRDPAAEGQDVLVQINPTDGDVIVNTVRHVVNTEDLEDPLAQVTLEDAQDLQAGAQTGDYIVTGELEYNPGRIAAQTAKQVVMQRLREAERDLVFDEYIDKTGEVISATVQRIETHHVTVDLGRAEAILPPSEQSHFERLRPGQQLKFFIERVERTIRGPEIIVSRTHPDLLKRLFEVEVPEIYNGVIEIRAISREAGSRSKIAVSSNQEGVDAVGACVGLRGIRIQNVVNELLGEKIDIIEWDDDPVRFITNSLSPATVEQVVLDEENASALVVVPDRQLSLAIGREGQNARLAAKLSSWKIDIQGTTQYTNATVEDLVDTSEETSDTSVSQSQPDEDTKEPSKDTKLEKQLQDKTTKLDDEAIIEESEKLISDHEQSQETSQDMELLRLEEELAELEREEKERKSELESDDSLLDLSSDDLWQIKDSRKKTEDTGVIRFAEDISGFRDQNEGVRKRGGNRRKSKKR